jgi:AcrR family transcriptional regulator
MTDTRDRLIDAAMELFAFQGYAATGLAQIARQAGVLPGSLYYFFPTKADLLHATLERRKVLLHPEVLAPIWERVDDPIERVFGLLAGYRRMLEVTEFRHGCPIGNLVIEVGETHPHARALLTQNFEGWLDAVEECFAAARARLPEHADSRRRTLLPQAVRCTWQSVIARRCACMTIPACYSASSAGRARHRP